MKLALGFCVVLVACTTPPVGWEGAGRSQMLPAPQMDSGMGGGTGGGDTGTGDSGLGTLDMGFDAGFDAGCPIPEVPANCQSVCGVGSGCCPADGGTFACITTTGSCCPGP